MIYAGATRQTDVVAIIKLVKGGVKMKHMREYMAGLAAIGFVMAASAPSHATFASKGKDTLSASAVVGGTATITITSYSILTRASNASASSIVWTSTAPTPGAGWLVADDYIQMVTDINTSDGGVQIYTDNTNASASPKFTGSISSYTVTPAGLVDNTDTTQKIPTAWMASTTTVPGIVAIDPNANSGTSYLWFYNEDHAQVAVPSLNTSAFGNGDPYATVYASPGTPLVANSPNGTTTGYTTTATDSGLHYAQGPTQFGGYQEIATTNIYIEANFATALQGTTYSTGELVLEAFSL
jgi:hypothetical protein